MNKSAIFEAFKELGWKIRHHGVGNYYFERPDGKELQIKIWFPSNGDIPYKIEWEFGEYFGGVVFTLNECVFEWGEDRKGIDLIAKRNSHIFIGFYNFKKEENASQA